MTTGAELDPNVDIEERLRTVCGHLNVLNAQLVELAAEALMTEAWAGCGVRSLQHWLTWQAGISPGHAREVVRLAEARDTHPAIMSTFAAGAISIDQAAAATKAPAYLDEHLAQTVTYATVPQLRTMARGARTVPPAPKNPELAPSESLAGWFDDDGRYHLRGELDADRGRLVDAALTEARDALFRAGQAEGRRGLTRWWRWPTAAWTLRPVTNGGSGSASTGSSTLLTRSRHTGPTVFPSPPGCGRC